MNKNKTFLSLKWKQSISIGLILISLFSAYSYYFYQQTLDHFLANRQTTQQKQINIARAISNESFFVLERFAESISIIVAPNNAKQPKQFILNLFDEYWTHWELIWGLEGASFYSLDNKKIKQWGKGTTVSQEAIKSVFTDEIPQHRFDCHNGCFQQIITPVLINAKLVGALSLSVSLSDSLLQYQDTVDSDIGLLINDNKQTLSILTHAEKNTPIWQQFRASHELQSFTDNALGFVSNQHRYEIRAFSIKQNQKAPYFVMINDISSEYYALQEKLYRLAAIGLAGLLFITVFLYITIQLSLKNVSQLSKALPLLAQHKYEAFNNQLNQSKNSILADEMSTLTESAIHVSQQLKTLEFDAQKNTQLLIQKASELTRQRNFMEQLIDTAPIVIITQSVQGMILSINKEALQDLEKSAAQIIGRPFADFIHPDETEHLLKLNQLQGIHTPAEINYSGRLNIHNGEPLFISWIHSLLFASDPEQETIILSLGVDITEQHIADEQLVWIATHDQLTGLSNRRNFQQELNTMMAIANRYKNQLALFYLDLDQFKIINDTHGHQAGDDLLQHITSVLKKEVRETDLLSRIGGDEFTLVVPAATEEGIHNLANKLLQALKAIDYTINNQTHPISFSIGVAIYPQHGKNQMQLLANADLAMYHAKQTGRSRYHIFSPSFEYQAILTEQLHWKKTIEHAIKQDQFILYYQPILDIKHKKISHYECLLRIELADKKILMPGDFITQAEQIGLIDQIDRLVLKKAIEQHLAFQKIGNNARLAINLSGRSMNDESILPYIEELLSQEHVKPELIIFEITETSAVSNFLSAKSMIKKLNELGCHFALDDFGVGFSSFYYLKSLPVDYVKIDGSFVKQMDISEEDRIFVKVLTEVSQAFGKKIIAEFVENQAILNLLEQQGVDYAQGYYISKPIRDPLDLSHVQGLK
ncbi:MAG: EAL domain-containing protein [Methyloprofundus sp.]|nr:EAL domain-containing protein [Methyloprofundus sp.]